MPVDSANGRAELPAPAPLFQFSLARILIAVTLSAIYAATVLPWWGDEVSRWYWLGILVLLVLFVDISHFYVQFGNRAIQAGKYDRAVDWYSRAIAGDPGNAGYFYARGCAHDWLGDGAAALADYSRATRLDARLPHAWIGRCLKESAQGEFASAIDSSTMALVLTRDNADALLIRGTSYLALGRLEEALADFDYLLDLHPTLGSVYRWRGCAHHNARRYAEALDDFHAAELHHCGEELTVDRCITLYRMGRSAEALTKIAEFVESHPQHAAAIATEAFFLATCPEDALRDGERALALCEQARAQGGFDNWVLDASFAAAYAELGRFDEAVRHAEEALAGVLPYRKDEYQARLDAYRAGQPWRNEI